VKKAIVVGGIVIGALLVLVLFLPVLFPPPGTGVDLGVKFYDKDGNQLGLPLGFVGSSGPCESVQITFSYTVTSTNERFEENLEVWGNVLIQWRVGTDGTWTTSHDLPVSKSQAATGSWVFSYNLRDIITVDEMGKTYGWEVKITGTLTSETVMSEGEVVTSAPSVDTAFFMLGWETDSLVITGVVDPVVS